MIFENGERIIIYFILKLFSPWLEVLGDSWWWLLVMEMLLLCLKDKLLIAFWKDFHDGRKLKANCKEKKIYNTVEEYLLWWDKKERKKLSTDLKSIVLFFPFFFLKINANWLKKNEIKLIIEKVVFMNAYIFFISFSSSST